MLEALARPGRHLSKRHPGEVLECPAMLKLYGHARRTAANILKIRAALGEAGADSASPISAWPP